MCNNVQYYVKSSCAILFEGLLCNIILTLTTCTVVKQQRKLKGDNTEDKIEDEAIRKKKPKNLKQKNGWKSIFIDRDF